MDKKRIDVSGLSQEYRESMGLHHTEKTVAKYWVKLEIHSLKWKLRALQKLLMEAE